MDAKKPNRGDLIEFKRSKGGTPFSHWGVYLGDGEVAHVVRDPKDGEYCTVKKENLHKVADGGKWEVNNKQDKELPPRSPDEIVSEANEWVGQTFHYNLWTDNCEHFATSVRNNQPVSQQPNRGDLIEFKRSKGGTPFSHWGVYLGDGEVAHVVRDPKDGEYCTVKKENLHKVADGGKWEVNNKQDKEHPPRSPDEIVSEANEWVGQTFHYNLWTDNCEHFATSVRNNQPVSQQPNRGDLIEFKRSKGGTPFSHWGVYLGDGEVAHVVRDPKDGEYCTVKKENLHKVADGGKWEVNNKQDKEHPPRSPDEIVSEANEWVGQTFHYNLWTDNCEHFATSVRNNQPVSQQPNRGDLIEFKRSKGGTPFSHWGVYLGDGEVAHVVHYPKDGEYCTVKKENLHKVADGGKWEVNNKQDKELPPRSPDEIVSEANKWVGQPFHYNLWTDNCEHFATSVRNNQPVSQQVRDALLVVGAFGTVALTAALIAATVAAVEAKKKAKKSRVNEGGRVVKSKRVLPSSAPSPKVVKALL